ncbi:MAG: flagellar motor switch protein FliG [Actinobacteria bacterium]|nr:flagellar motor switch protein FliG [Actinomycetota bacterium]
MKRAKQENMPGARKAALLVLSLRPEHAAKVLGHLDDEVMAEIATEIASLGNLPKEAANSVVEEFGKVWDARSTVVSGGLGKARNLLELAAPDKAGNIVDGIDRKIIDPPFSWVSRVDTQVMARSLSAELPITCAVVLSFVDADTAASIMLELPADMRSQIAVAIASLDDPDHELVEAIEQGVRERLGPNAFERQYRVGGIDSLVALLNRSDRETETDVLAALGAIDEHLAGEVKRRLFLFEDIATLDPRAIQKVLASVDTSKLPLAMKGVGEDTKRVLLENMSERAAEVLREEIDILGPARLADVQAAQAEVVSVVNRLDAEGEITINRGSDALVA